MGYRKNRKRSNGRRSKLHTVKQRCRRTSKKHSCLSSCVHNRCCLGSEALRKMQMMKALDFGIQSGYLVPTDKTYRILHVSSDLLRKQKRRKSATSLTRNYRRIGYDEDSWNLRDREKNDVGRKNRMNPKFEEYPVQDAKRRRRSRSKRRSSRRRSRSRSKNKRRRSSRKRSRSRRSSNNSEKMGDDEDDYEQEENITKKNSRNEHTTDNNNDSRNSRSKSPGVDKTNIEKSPDDISDVSLDDDDDSEDEDDKKKSNDS